MSRLKFCLISKNVCFEQGDRLKEAQNINKSLSALGDCVQSLVAKAKHVPFRNSKLTFLLQVDNINLNF